MTRQNAQSITPFNTFTASPQIDGTDPQRAPLHVVSRGQSRASNDALAWLAVQDVTPGVHDFGVYLAKMARFATTADGRRKATAGEVMCYPLQKTMAKERGCSVRQIKRLVRSLREVGLEVRQRVRPYGATYVFPVPSDVPSDVPSQREPRTEPRTEKKERTVSKLTNFPSKRADTGQTKQQRLVAAVCWKLGFSVTAAGLEEFDGREHAEKQKLITRLLRAETRHDRRAARDTVANATPGAKPPNKTKGGNKATVANATPGTNVPPAAKKPKKTKGKAKTSGTNVPPAAKTKSFGISAKKQISQFGRFQGRPRSGRLQAEYADRYRAAHVTC